MTKPYQILAFSGGKDSTVCALAMAENGEEFDLFYTPTADESDECLAHIASVAKQTGRKLIVRNSGHTLYSLIEGYGALPNNRQRWCTRQLKIEPAKAYLLEHPGSILCVGLRADEEERQGMWGEFATYRYPLREYGFGIEEVYGYLAKRGVVVPERTDCDLCYDQRLAEWWKLWKEKPEKWAKGEALEAATGHTFRSPSRDTWPAAMAEMRARFEAGETPKGIRSLPLFDSYETKSVRCRVCSM